MGAARGQATRVKSEEEACPSLGIVNRKRKDEDATRITIGTPRGKTIEAEEMGWAGAGRMEDKDRERRSELPAFPPDDLK